MSDLLKGLNDAQMSAVQHVEGPLLALAGAGTGKTHVLITRIAYIVENYSVPAEKILAVTFTNKAASEMKSRLAEKCVQSQFSWCGTFHSMAVKMLRRHVHVLGYDRGFAIIDVDDQIRVVEGLVEDYAQTQGQMLKKRELARKVLDFIQRWKDKGLWSHQVVDEVVWENGRSSSVGKIAQKVYPLYQETLSQMRCIDYGDILLLCVRMFQESEEVLSFYQNFFSYVCVDEFQDTNVLQEMWVRLLADKHHNIFCVGDDDQSIYRWRGAEITNILSFAERYPDAKVVRLEKNYRSTRPILAAASALIAHNKQRLGKELWTDREGGDLVHVRGFWSPRQEGSWVALRLLSAAKSGVPLNKIAVLVRSNYLTRAYEDALAHMNVPYRVIGGMRFYDRMEVKDILAYMRLVMRPYDDLAFYRCCNAPKRGMGEVKLAQIRAYAREHALSALDALRALCCQGVFKGASGKGAEEFLKMIDEWAHMAVEQPLSVVLKDIVERSGYQRMLSQEESVTARARMDNIRELYTAADEFHSCEEFLEHISLMTSTDVTSSESMVNIMTIHAAKGLEFSVCFLVAWERDVFPTRRALDSLDINALEEERRLAYVALTRARDIAYITFVQGEASGFNRGRGPSAFLKELPRESLDVRDVSG